MEHIPSALLLHEIMWDSAHSWTSSPEHILLHCWQWWLHCVQSIKHLWIWTCWTNCTVFSSWAFAKCKHTYNEPGRDVTWTALVISSDLCSVWQFHIFHIAMTGSSLLSSCSVLVFLNSASWRSPKRDFWWEIFQFCACHSAQRY